MSDTLETLRQLARVARDLDMEIAELEEKLATKQDERRTLTEDTLPEKLAGIGMSSFTLEAEGNNPKCLFKLDHFAEANISPKWEPDKIRKAFDTLKKHNGEDLIKVEVVFRFPRGQREAAQNFARLNNAYNPDIKETVHHSSLGAWLREEIKSGRPTPDLEAIGARVGSTVKIVRD